MFKRSGFTMVELMVVVAIIAILSSIAFATYNSTQKAGRDAKRRGDVSALRQALEQYKAGRGNYPCFDVCGSGGWAIPSGTALGLSPDYIQTIPQDPSSGTACPGYLYSDGNNGTRFTLFIKLESSNDSSITDTKPAPLAPPAGSTDCSNGCASFTVPSGTCGEQVYNYWVNSSQ